MQSVARRALLSATAPLRPLQAQARNFRAASRVLAEHDDREVPRTKLATRLVHPVSTTKDPYGGSSPPLYQTATFAFESGGEYDYSRSGNPTRTQLESVMAQASHSGPRCQHCCRASTPQPRAECIWLGSSSAC